MRKLCELNDIPLGQARGFSVQGGPILIHRSEQGIRAYRDSCPHLGIDLAWNPDAATISGNKFSYDSFNSKSSTISSNESTYKLALSIRYEF